MRKLLIIAGVPVDDMSLPEVLDQVQEFIRLKTPHQIATVNADFVLKARDDPELRHILNRADILTPDGMPLIWGARLLGVNLKGRVTGADLVPALAERGARLGWRFFFLGGRPGIPERAAQNMAARYPGLQVVGMYSPPFAPVVELTPEIDERIRAAHPDILLVAFGNPKQEKWIYMHAEEINVPVSIGIGGALDFEAGELLRAPLWMQNAGLEWLFRLIQEPGRMWKRYVLDIGYFTRFFFLQWWRQKVGGTLSAMRSPQSAVSDPLLEGGALPSSPSSGAPLPRPAGEAAGGEGEPPSDSGPRASSSDHLPSESGSRTADSEPRSSDRDLRSLSLVGMLTVSECPAIQARIEEALRACSDSSASCAGLRLKMGGVRFIDSAGMGMLVNLTRLARSAGKELRLEGLSPEILSTLRMLRLDSFLAVHGQENDETPKGSTSIPQPRLLKLDENSCLVMPMPPRLEGLAARALPGEVEQALAAYGQDSQPAVIADFSQTSFIDSSGIAALLAVQRKLQAAATAAGNLPSPDRPIFVLAGLAKDVRWVLDLSGVARLFTIRATLEEAVQAPGGRWAPPDGTNTPGRGGKL